MQITLRPHDLIQGVVEGPQIGIDLALEIPGQKAQLLPRLNGRASQDNPPHLPVLKGLDRHRHGKVGLARTRGADAEHDHLLADGVHVLLLSHGLGLHRLTGDGAADNVLVDLQDLPVALREGEGQGVVHVLLRDGVAPSGQLHQIAENTFGLADGLLRPD